MKCWFVGLDGERFAQDVGPAPPAFYEIAEMDKCIDLHGPITMRRRHFRRVEWAEKYAKGHFGPMERWFEYREIDDDERNL